VGFSQSDHEISSNKWQRNESQARGIDFFMNEYKVFPLSRPSPATHHPLTTLLQAIFPFTKVYFCRFPSLCCSINLICLLVLLCDGLAVACLLAACLLFICMA